MTDLTNEQDAEALFREPEAVLLKHGAHCPISAGARNELDSFSAAHPGIPVYRLDVSEQRELSQDLAHRLGVPHESPQAFVLRDGRVVWHESHYRVNAKALAKQIGAANGHDGRAPRGNS
jgi:thioredoxin 1